MNPVVTQGIVLTRVDYAEADRILTFLTPQHGKVAAIAKGVRKTKSKLAGGIELFSVSDISYIVGRRDIATLISTRLRRHYGQIVKDLDRTQTGYEILRLLHKATEDHPEEAYFNLLEQSFEALEDPTISPALIKLWFDMQLLRLAGHTPNLRTDASGKPLLEDVDYDFELEAMRFRTRPGQPGTYSAKHIKFLRIGFSPNSPHALNRVKGSELFAASLRPVVQSMLENHVRT